MKKRQRTKREVNYGQEVACTHVLGVIFQEGRPGLRGGLGRADAGDVLLNRLLGDSEAELEQFPADAFGTPEPILLCHLLDQGDGLRR